MEQNEETSPTLDTSSTFLPGHAPKEEDVQYTIGPYRIIKSVGKGGMGEVLLAYDTKCGRRVALKRIREDLLEHKLLYNRFLKEARITSQLTHPVIMPIYAIEDTDGSIYYTMPFIKGKTLKQILRTTREQEKIGEKLHHIGGSIPALIRIFISICQAVAYAHSKGVLHRDLKPENIMLGQYGEIFILDWGLAKLIGKKEAEEGEQDCKPSSDFHELTRPGKIVGTINFMAPERILGQAATLQTEIYSLGVILYQILTLRNPFNRGRLEDFRKKIDQETLIEPAVFAPYRDVPPLLSRIAMKCLSKEPDHRYPSVNALLSELENYIEGRSEWFQIAELDINRKTDWEFQENVLIAEHIAITRGTDAADWVSLMISKTSFPENTKMEATVEIGEKGSGIGFLMSVPEAAERTHLNDGYCIWLGSDINKTTKLLRSTVEVISAPEIFLNRNQTYHVRIEKIDHNIHFYLNDTLQLSYISHLPLVGTHFGILARDADFSVKNCTIFIGSQSLTLNCLAVPDAFLAHKNYAAALSEYRRIGYSFPGRAEGREAMFRAGITILEELKSAADPVQKEKLFDEALAEFEKLHATPGAPLEYLGKAHAYQAMQEVEDEIRCYEMGFRKYPRHPLLSVLHESLIYRMHVTSRLHRKATYLFMLTALKHLPDALKKTYTKKLFESLEKHWEPLFFIQQEPDEISSNSIKSLNLQIQLSFWLAKPHRLVEIIEETDEKASSNPVLICNALYCMLELGAWKLANKIIQKLPDKTLEMPELNLINIGLLSCKETPQAAIKAFFAHNRSFNYSETRILLFIINQSILEKQELQVEDILKEISYYDLSKEIIQRFDCYAVWHYLLESKWEKAEQILHKYPLTLLTQESSLLFTLYGCWLAATENREIAAIHFSGALDIAYPRTWNLLGQFINGKISLEGRWGATAFMWEKRQLFKELELFYHCIGDAIFKEHFCHLESQEYVQE